MYRKTFKLKQHTPLIHFQHDQAGATLRATEVKPKLDRFLLERCLSDLAAIPNSIAQNGERKQWVNYRLAIQGEMDFTEIRYQDRESYPMFFANMGDEYREKPRAAGWGNNLSVVVMARSAELFRIIDREIGAFFSATTFGVRSSKGYGSFSVQGDNRALEGAFSFTIPAAQWKRALNYVDLFYRSIRGGINGVVPTVRGYLGGEFYMKPLLFAYAHDNDVQWEKRTIKQNGNVFPYRDGANYRTLRRQEDKHFKQDDSNKKDWPVGQFARQNYLVRDLMGLSMSQSWKGYRNGNGVTVTIKPAQSKEEMRFKSPWIFKPEKTGNQFRITVFTNPIPVEYLNQLFEIKAGDDLVETMTPWPNFNMNDFIRNYLTVQKVEDCMWANWNNDQAQDAADHLTMIYEQIELNRNV